MAKETFYAYVGSKSEDTAPDANADFIVMKDTSASAVKRVLPKNLKTAVELVVACSDETTSITTGTAKVSFRMPFSMVLFAGNLGLTASANVAPTGSTIVIDVNEGDSPATILSTKLSIDASEKTSTTAASAVVISDTALAYDALVTIDFDQVGATIPGAGIKVTFKGYKV